MQTVELYAGDTGMTHHRPWATGTFRHPGQAETYRRDMAAAGWSTYVRDATPIEMVTGPFPRITTVRDVRRGRRRVWR